MKANSKEVTFMVLECFMNPTAINMKGNGKKICVMVKENNYTSQNYKCTKVSSPTMNEMGEENTHTGQETFLMDNG
jgi:hypothetical protein